MLSISSTTTTDSRSSQIGKSKHKPVTSPTTLGGPDFTTCPVRSAQPHHSATESRFHCSDLPSKLVLVARTGSTSWEEPTDAGMYSRKFMRNHGGSEIWHALAHKMRLNKGQMDWTSIDVDRGNPTSFLPTFRY